MKSLTLTETVILLLLVLGLALLILAHSPIGILFFVLAVLLGIGSLHTIPANPPTVAVPTVWGKRQTAVIHERLALASPIFPLVENLIIIGVTRQSRIVEVKNVRCKAIMASSKKLKKRKMIGSSVDIHVGLVFQPDVDHPGSLVDYLNAGGKGWPPFFHQDGELCVDKEAEERDERDAVWKQLEIIITGALRQEASTRTWVEVAESKAELSAKLITRLTGQRPTVRVVRNAHGIPQPDLDHHTIYEYLIEPIPDGYELQEEDYMIFLQEINANGARDVKGLGIVVRSATVEEVEPEEAVRHDAAESDREAAQRDAEKIDFDTELMLAEKYLEVAKKHGKEMVLDDALKYVRINRDRAEEIVINSTTDSFLAGAALIGGQRRERRPRGGRSGGSNRSGSEKGPDSKP